MCAALGNAQKATSLLIIKGADVNMKINERGTPLMHAAHKDSVDVLKALIVAGADVDQKAKDGTTALMAAAEQRSVHCFLELLKHGARRYLRNDERQSVYDIAKEEKADDDPAMKVKQRAIQQILDDLESGKSFEEV